MPSAPPPSVATKIFYGIGSVAFGVKDNGFAFFLLLYYSQVLGLPEQQVGLAIMLALMADALFDPLVGYASDHLHSRWGRRHPFMYAAAIPVGVAYYFLWCPPAHLSGNALFGYLLGVSIGVRVLIACFEIPSSSLVAELTEDYDQRTSILSYRFFFGWWGGLTMAALAYSVFLQPDAAHPVGVLNPEGYHHYGLFAAVSMTVSILVSAAGTHHCIPYLKQPPVRSNDGVRGAMRELWQTLANPSFLRLFGAGVFAGMAAGLTAALTLYFNTYFWELTSSQMSVLVLLNFVSAMIAVGIAPALSVRLGKKPAAIAASFAGIMLGPLPVLLRVAGWFPATGSVAFLPTLAIMNTLLVTVFITSSILVASMVADVAEDSEVSTGRRSEGVFFAANAFVQKSVSGIGIFTSTLLLRAIGFPADAKPGEVAPEIVRNLGLVYAPAIVVLYLCALAFLAGYKITRESHTKNLERLGRGARRPAA
jgi:glycoside/pentoside/hexuronide:cation symporter, GPH family